MHTLTDIFIIITIIIITIITIIITIIIIIFYYFYYYIYIYIIYILYIIIYTDIQIHKCDGLFVSNLFMPCCPIRSGWGFQRSVDGRLGQAFSFSQGVIIPSRWNFSAPS